MRAGIAALRSVEQKITAESLKQVTRGLEPGFAGLSFQVIRRNPRAYELYREAAAAFSTPTTSENNLEMRRQRRARRSSGRVRRSSYDPLQRFDKRALVQRIRTLEQELVIERQQRGGLAYDQQTLLAKILRLETELILSDATRIQLE